MAAGTVAFSRVYTGVHYPGDVAVGVTVGALIGAATSRIAVRAAQRWEDRRTRATAAAEVSPAEPE
jgi:membrane-associated phospholipid phosphatase